jgi:hypothetical protein
MPYMVEPKHVRDGLVRIGPVAAEHGRSADEFSAALFARTAVAGSPASLTPLHDLSILMCLAQ